MLPIRLENLTKRFVTPRGTVLAVDEVSLTVDSGEFFFLLGPSGCGKTTLLRMLAGFVEPSAGRIFFGQRDVTHVPPEKRDSAMVFQNYALWPHMTVARNVGFGPTVRKVPAGERRRIVAELLETVRIAEKASAKPMELSGGQQQRVALARALAVRPACLLLDEPLSNLDAALRSAMRWEIRRIVKATGTTGVYVTHDQAEAMAMADRIGLMKDGGLVQVGAGPELYDNPASRFVAEFLGEANFLPATVLGPTTAIGTEPPPDGARLLALDTPLGRFVGRCAAPLPPGAKVVCCIRPESLRLNEADGGGEGLPAGVNTLTGRLADWTHLGESARFRLVLGDGTELSGSTMPARRRAGLGQQVSVSVPPGDVIVLGA